MLPAHDEKNKNTTTTTNNNEINKTIVAKAQEVALDAATGDYYAFDSETDRWVAEGNVGVQKHGGKSGGGAAAIWADAPGALEGYLGAKKVCLRLLILRGAIVNRTKYC